VIKAIYAIVQGSNRNKIPVSVCGEMAGDPIGSLLLIGLGINELSVETTSFLRIKKLVRMIKYSEAKRIAQRTLNMTEASQVKDYLLKSYEKLTRYF
jgi:phosphoenolpyruvate-protein kinase (PTS system EI component)